MTIAANGIEVYIRDVVTAPTNPTHLIDGINKLTVTKKRDLLESTDFKDTSGARTRLAGLADLEATLDGDYEPTDTAQTYCRTALANGTSVWLSYYHSPGASTGSKGYKVECLVESESFSAGFDGKVEVSYALKATGAAVVDS